MRWLSCIALLSFGCHSAPTTDPVPTAAATVAATAAPTTNATAAAKPMLDGKLTLQSGATLKMPEGAKQQPMPQTNRLPDNVKKASVFNLGTGDDISQKRLLMVNEITLAGKTCEAALDEELDRLKKAKSDADPMRNKYRQMVSIDTVKTGGHRVLYADSKNRGLDGKDAGRPRVAMATAIGCRDKDFIVLMYTLAQPELPAGTKEMLTGVLASYNPGP